MEALIAMAESIAPLLLAEGISCPDAERVLRSVCIHEAARAEASRGHRPNASRLALLTGVDRHVVARILQIAPKPDPAQLQTHRHRLNRVLAAWHSDPDYCEAGRPRALEIRAGQRRRTFWTLSKAHAKDAYPPLILNELLKVGAVEKLRNGRVRPRARTYKAKDLDEEAVQQIGARVRDLTRTMLSNMSAEAGRRVCETVQTADIDPGQLALVRQAVQERTHEMMVSVRELLSSPRWRRTSGTAQRVRVAFTSYLAEEALQESAEAAQSAKVRAGVRRKPHVPVRAAARKVGRKTGW